MSNGYSLAVVNAMRQADPDLLGVRLGRVCVGRDISVAYVAEHLGVSRMTVYAWFTGQRSPGKLHACAVQEMLDKLLAR